jgi:HK97 family phage portal protein
MSLLERFRAASKAFQFPTRHTHRGGAFVSIAQRTFPYENTDPISNSAVMNCLAWIQRNFIHASLDVYQMDEEDEKEVVNGHPMVRLIKRPNAFYQDVHLWYATLLSYHLDGNAYWLKARNGRGFGVPTELWYEPHWSIRPHYPDDGTAFVDYYERRVNGTIERIPVENVVHFRNGLNPANPRMGLAPIKAALLNVFTDTEVSQWVAALCRNMAIPGVVLNPTEMIGMSPEKAENIKQVWKRKFGGDNRGEPLMLDFPASVTTLGFNPADMDFSAISAVAETRISGALGIPAIVAGLYAGLDSSTYNNLDNLRKAAFEESLIPTWYAFAAHLTAQLLPDFTRNDQLESVVVGFDTSEIRALQENQGEKEQRAIEALMAGVATINETRAQFGYDPIENGDYTYLPNSVTIVGDMEDVEEMEGPDEPEEDIEDEEMEDEDEDELEDEEDTEEPEGEDVEEAAHHPLIHVKQEIWNGIPVSRMPTELEARAIKSIDDEFNNGVITLSALLLALRERYIEQLAQEIGSTDPEDYARIVLEPTEDDRARIEALLLLLFGRGANLITQELRQQGIDGQVESTPDSDLIATLAILLAIRIANDVRARGVAAAIRGAITGQVPSDYARAEMLAGSTAYVQGAAAEMTNTVLAQGREAEMNARANDIRLYIYSAVLDVRTCGPCRAADGTRGPRASLPPVPNPNCAGGTRCRCVILPVATSNVTAGYDGQDVEAKARYRGRDVNLKPTDGMKSEAQRGLDWRSEFGRGGTAVGIARARDIVNGKELSPSTVRRMFSFFSRHEVDKQAEGFRPGEKGYPSNGRIAWALWGGDAGFAWAKKKRAQLDNIDDEA